MTATTVSPTDVCPTDFRPTEKEIAAVAYQFWKDSGCPAGSDQEYWFRAEAALKKALFARLEEVPVSPANPCRDSRPQFETPADFRWEGHWEVWEREWCGARWIWDACRADSGQRRLAVSSRAH